MSNTWESAYCNHKHKCPLCQTIYPCNCPLKPNFTPEGFMIFDAVVCDDCITKKIRVLNPDGNMS